jgi:hypothetical protein
MVKQMSLSVLLLTLMGCANQPVPENNLKADVEFLASDELQGRQTGSEGEKKAADYIAQRFDDLGLEEKGTNGYFQDFKFTPKTDPHSEASFTESEDSRTVIGRNVLGYIDNKAERTIVIGAHYDHLGYGDLGGSLFRGEEKEIHNGADDNASGVAVMLNLAYRLRDHNKNNNYFFMAFSGEELGLLGSNFFVKNSTVPIDKINYMFNMDMVGRLSNEKTLAIYGTGTSPLFKQTVMSNNETFKIIENESGVGPSDHTSFYLGDIPVLHFFTGQHSDYHKPTDDADKLNYEGMQLISDYIFTLISDLDNNGKLAFRKTASDETETPRFKVTLGVIPDYLFDGEGMRIDGVSEDKPAQKAGLQKGDVVVALGDYDVKHMMGYMQALSKFEEGNSTTVKVKRGDQVVSVEVTF